MAMYNPDGTRGSDWVNPTTGVGAYLPGYAPMDVLQSAGYAQPQIDSYYAQPKPALGSGSDAFAGGGGFGTSGSFTGGGSVAPPPAPMAAPMPAPAPVMQAAVMPPAAGGYGTQWGAMPPAVSGPATPMGTERGQLKSAYMKNNGDPLAVSQYMQQNGYTPEMAAQELGIPIADVNSFLATVPRAQAAVQPPAQPPMQPQGGAFGGAPVYSGAPGAVGNNPYLGGMADEIGRRSQQGLDQAFNSIRSNSVGNGTLGGSRQGVAQGVATGMANDALTGNLANLYGTDWTNQQNRNLSQYGMDQGFYTQQRGQDQTGAALGASLYSQGMNGMWDPLRNASNLTTPYTGLNSSQTSGSSSGGGLSGAAGGALGAAQLAKNFGWW